MGHVLDLALELLDETSAYTKDWQLGLYLDGTDPYGALDGSELEGNGYARVDLPAWVVDPDTTETGALAAIRPDITTINFPLLPTCSLKGAFLARPGDTACMTAWPLTTPVAVVNNGLVRIPGAALVFQVMLGLG